MKWLSSIFLIEFYFLIIKFHYYYPLFETVLIEYWRVLVQFHLFLSCTKKVALSSNIKLRSSIPQWRCSIVICIEFLPHCKYTLVIFYGLGSCVDIVGSD